MSPAYHTTGRSAALHSETYGSAEIRAITVASGRFYRKPPPGFTDHPLLTPRGALIAGRAEQQAAMQKAAADYARLVPSVRWLDPAETLRRQPLLKPEAAAGGAIFEEAEDMDVAAIHGGFLKGARAAGAVLRLDAEVTTLDAQGRTLDDRPARRRERRGRQPSSTPSGAWADVVARTGRRGAGRPGAEAAHRLHLRRAAGLDLARLPMAIDFDETWYIKPEVGQFLGSPADETPSPPCDAQPEEIDIAIAVERIETATTLADPPHQEQMGGPAQLRRRQEPGRRLRSEGRGLLLAGRPGRLRHPDRRGGGTPGRQPCAGQGHAGRHRCIGSERRCPFARTLHAPHMTVIEKSRIVAKA